MSDYFDSLLAQTGLTPTPRQPTLTSIGDDHTQACSAPHDLAEISTEAIIEAPRSFERPTSQSNPASVPPPSPAQDVRPLNRILNDPKAASNPATKGVAALPGELTQNPDSAALVQQVLAWISRDSEPERTDRMPDSPRIIKAQPATSGDRAQTGTPQPAARSLQPGENLGPAARLQEKEPRQALDSVTPLSPAEDREESNPRPGTLTSQGAQDAVRPGIIRFGFSTLDAVPDAPAAPARLPSTPPPAAPATSGESTLNVSIGSIHLKLEGPAPAPIQAATRAVAPAPSSRQTAGTPARAYRSNRLSRHAL